MLSRRMPEAHARLDVNPLVVGAAMANDVAHPVHKREIRVVPAGAGLDGGAVRKSCNSTHSC